MTIESITLFRQWQPFRDGTYRCSGGRSAEGFDSTIVEIRTRDGHAGYGEMAPLGSFYDPAFAEGARAAMRELCPRLVGADASGIEKLNRRMDLLLKGHPYAKAAIDMALWDLAGKRAGQPLAALTGGAEGNTIALYRSLAQEAPDAMARRAQKYVAEGYRRLQVKVGLDVDEDVARLEAVRAAVPSATVLFCDANASWGTAEVRRFLSATRSIDYVLEQPCASYEENLAVRSACDRPLVLDETIDGVDVLLRAISDGLVDGITIKLARVGGITRAKLIRDVAIARNLKITIEDTGGAEIDTSAYCALMLSTPESLRQHTVDFHNWVTVSNARAEFRIEGGAITPPSGPGLGVEVDTKMFGDPIFVARQ
ncbi:mandelate racemase/muconate lactonizing enzyme family protein [Mesorhizobium sp. IMUNJ 23232]|uniref:mandelate racemase/muconate lactonizing enzyme family protein n=1 Tax=Mesorhizobium sp. IMUNJ 23232 TaxID=3376064 RepID=UPI0037B40F96